MKRNFTSLSLLILICFYFLSVSGIKAAGNQNSQQQFTEGSYKPGILIIRVKEQFRSSCTTNDISLSQFNTAMNLIGANGLSKKFPRHQPPAIEKNEYGSKLADLSLIYQVHFSPIIKIEEAVRIIKATGLVEYAEPEFIRRPTFTPNDPGLPGQYFLQKINAYLAWDVWTGDTNVVIGIVDTGTDWDHPDLQANIKYNYADLIDNIDNDSDGFIDNYRGWDVSENDNNPMVGLQSHGSHVSGCADAVTNNSIGVASPGYNCKFLPVKAAFDASGNSIDNGPDGIVYAADHGCDVINCSFGGGNYSQAEQDVITYATINKNALVVASAGNSYAEGTEFPASYEYVISVASTNNSDTKSNFSTWGTAVDVSAPGSNIYSTIFNNSYDSLSGTSMASPIAAGCAAMIKSRFPALNARQVGEQLRTTCDNINSLNPSYYGKLGKGRVNLYRAVTDSISPGVILKRNNIRDGNDNVFIISDTLFIVSLLENLLRPTTNLTCTLSTSSSAVQILQNHFTAGALNTFDTISNFASAFRVYIRPSAPVNASIPFRLTLIDGAWTDIFTFNVTVNVDYINIAVNNVATSITSKGMIGYNKPGQLEGIGFTYMNGPSMLYDMELMVGVQSLQVSDNVRGNPDNDEDFAPFVSVSSDEPGIISDFDINGSFKDNGATSSIPLDILVNHHAYAWSSAPHQNYVMVKYSIQNLGTTPLNNLYAGLFADWDIPDLANNKCSTDVARRMGYAWCTDTNGLWAGIKLLSNSAGFNHYAIDNSANSTGILMVDGFSDSEKFTSLSAFNPDAGMASPTGIDVISVVSTGGVTLAPGDSVEIAFALIAGEDLASLQTSADAAQQKYDSIFVGLEPIANANRNELLQAYPNPGDREIRIDFSLTENNFTDLSIYNVLGEKIKTIIHERLSAGKYTMLGNVSDLTEGNYFYRIQSGNFTKTLPLTVVH